MRHLRPVLLVSLHVMRVCVRCRFHKEGEPGRKVTCQACHVAKYGDTPAALGEAEQRADRDLADKTKKKNRKDSQLILRLSKEERDAFVELCDDLDTSAAREIRRFIRGFLKEHQAGGDG